MRLLLLFALVGVLTYQLPAQQLERTVVASAGGYQSHTTVGNLHWTVGEMVVDKLQNRQVLSQGFQQGYTIDVVSAIGNEAFYDEIVTVKVFPNPASNWIQVETALPGALEVDLTDQLGRHLFTHSIAHTNGIIDLQPLPPGSYILRIMQKGQLIRTFRIQKVDS